MGLHTRKEKEKLKRGSYPRPFIPKGVELPERDLANLTRKWEANGREGVSLLQN